MLITVFPLFVLHLGIGAPALFVVISLETAGQSHSVLHGSQLQGKEETGDENRLFSVSHGPLLSFTKGRPGFESWLNHLLTGIC